MIAIAGGIILGVLALVVLYFVIMIPLAIVTELIEHYGCLSVLAVILVALFVVVWIVVTLLHGS